MSVTSEELNFLVFRYLQESGFSHSAFTFAYESLITKSKVAAADLPPGALISLLQKGLQYVEIESRINEDGSQRDCPDPFALLMPHHASRKRKRTEGSGASSGAGSDKKTADQEAKSAPVPTVRQEQVSVLRGHSSEVFVCAWNPVSNLLASGSKDRTARIWGIPSGASGVAASEVASLSPRVLDHAQGSSGAAGNSNGTATADQQMDVTTLDWNPTGKLLATGTFDGQARIWSADGQLQTTLRGHTGPIFSLKWNKSGTALLSGSVDHTAIVWDPIKGSVRQQFKFHTLPMLDVDWRDDSTFATGSTDKLIHVCTVGQDQVVKTFSGHTNEVNAVRWSPSGEYLASCSDDQTTRIWSLSASGNGCVHNFQDHEKGVYTIQWSPTGPGSTNPNADLLLASASFDTTIRLWDPVAGKCLYKLVDHQQPVFSVAFSPSGKYLASGAFDRCLHIWSVKDGSIVKSYQGAGGVFDVCWNADGTRVSAGFANGSVAVIDTFDIRK